MRVQRSQLIERSSLDEIVAPRTGLVAESHHIDIRSESGIDRHRFELAEGPFHTYQRVVEVEVEVQDTHPTDNPPEGTRLLVRQTVNFKLAIPFFGFLFVLPARSELSRIGAERKTPWWAPPGRLDARGAQTLGSLALLSVVVGYMGTLLTQTVTYIADDFGLSQSDQGLVLASVRTDVVVALVLALLADRLGRRRVLLAITTAAAILTAASGLAPGTLALVGLQVPARGMLAAAGIIIAVMAAEEMPRTSRAFALGMLAMAGAFGPGICVALLFIADLDPAGWRILFLIAGSFVGAVWLAGRSLQESRRYLAPHELSHSFSGHWKRLVLLSCAALLAAIYLAPAAQFQNEFLRDERGYSGFDITLFSLITGTPGAIGIIGGGLLAERKGRRVVGIVGLTVGTVLYTASYLTTSSVMWATSLIGSVFAALTVPALSVYGPELFPTALRGKANGVTLALGRVGSAIGLVAVGLIADRTGTIGRGMLAVSMAPLLLAVVVWLLFPETARRSLEDINPEDRVR